MSANPIVVLGYARTPVGKFGMSLSGVPASSLGAIAAEAALERAQLSPVDVDEWIIGSVATMPGNTCCSQQVAQEAGALPGATAISVHRLCGSSMHAISTACQDLLAGNAQIVVTGGVENMTWQATGAPVNPNKPQLRARDYQVSLDRTYQIKAMALAAEQTARRFGISRHDQDDYAVESQRRAQLALSAGAVAGEIMPLLVNSAEGEVLLDTDEHPRPDVTLEQLARLDPLYDPDGTVTAGNTCGINDGGCALVLTRAATARQRGLIPLAELVDFVQLRATDRFTGCAPIPAIKSVLGRNRVRSDELSWVELHEAFAAETIAVIRETGLNQQRVNALGGAIAWGHPVGATGAILTARTIAQLGKGELGLASMPLGAEAGLAILWRGL